jgi:hypothetical protein
MNEVATREEKLADRVADVKSFDPGLGAYSFENLGQAVKFSHLMADSGQMLPEHLRGKPSLCLAVTMRAMQWKIDPFALALETYQASQGGVIAYQAKAFVMALKQCAGIRLQYEFLGSLERVNESVKSARGNVIAPRTYKGDRRVRAYATVDGIELDYVSPPYDEITIKNSPLWHSDPDQQLTYYAARGWVRRHEPGVMMGAYSVDEADAMQEEMRDVTPKKSGFAALGEKARIAAEQPSETQRQDATETVQDAEEPQDEGEPDAAHEIDPESPAYQMGFEAAREGFLTLDHSPFKTHPEENANWCAGFEKAKVDDTETA